MYLIAEYKGELYHCNYRGNSYDIESWREWYPEMTYRYYKEFPLGYLNAVKFTNLLKVLDVESRESEKN